MWRPEGCLDSVQKGFWRESWRRKRRVFRCERVFWSTSWSSLQQCQLVHLLHLRSGFDTFPHTDTFIHVWANSGFGTLRHPHGRWRDGGQKPNVLLWNSCSSVNIKATQSPQFVKNESLAWAPWQSQQSVVVFFFLRSLKWTDPPERWC